MLFNLGKDIRFVLLIMKMLSVGSWCAAADCACGLVIVASWMFFLTWQGFRSFH